ncbi:hypothetical protein TW65_06876 [Stemphylium lycopersici]|nr:hypothetical protein TW65_06876 [Stemphylium lycopersici]
MNDKKSDRAVGQQQDHVDKPSVGIVPPEVDISLSELSESSPVDIADEGSFLHVSKAHEHEDEDEGEDEDSAMLDVADSAVEQSNGEPSGATFQCRYCDKSYSNGNSLKHTEPVRGVHYQLLLGDPSQPLKTGPKSSRSGKDPAAKGEATKRKATTSPDASPPSKPVGKKDKIEHSHLRDNIRLQSSSQLQTYTGDEKLQEWRHVQHVAPSNLRDSVSVAPPSGPASMTQTSWNQSGEHPAAYPRAPRLRPHFPNADGSLQQGSSVGPPSGQPHERPAKDLVASAPGSRMPSRQPLAEPAQHPHAPKAVARKLAKKVAWERSEPTGENDAVFRLRIFGNSYDLNSNPIFSILTIRASQKFGPRLDAYCHQRNKGYGVDWIFIYQYATENGEEERYIKINYDMTPLDVYDQDSPDIKLRDMDTLVVMKGKSHLAAKVESDRKGVQAPSSPIGSQVSEQIVDVENGETPFYQNASTLTTWHRMIELKMMELRSQVARMDSEVAHHKQLGAQKDKTIAEMMARESVIQKVLCANRVFPPSRQGPADCGQNGARLAAGPARAPANARPNHFMARIESVREPAQPMMPRQPMPPYRFPTQGRRPDNRAAQNSLPGFDGGVVPPLEQTSQLLRQAGYPDGAGSMAYLRRARVGHRQGGDAASGVDANRKEGEEKK